MPSGPELSKTRLTTLPKDRGLLRDLLRERDLEDLIVPMFMSGAGRLDAVGVAILREGPGNWPGISRNDPAALCADDPCGASCPCHAAC